MIVNTLKKGNWNLTKTPKNPNLLLSHQSKTIITTPNHKKMTNISTNDMAAEREADHHPVLSKT